MFATTTSKVRPARRTAAFPARRSASRVSIRRPTRFFRAFSPAISTANGSMSVATAVAPSLAATMARSPVPQPRSSTVSPGRSISRSSASTQSRVVSWSPVPNAAPGSSRTRRSPGFRSGRSQLGTISTRRPRRSGLKWTFQASAQFSAGRLAVARSNAKPGNGPARAARRRRRSVSDAGVHSRSGM